jgi:hypothetical protein
MSAVLSARRAARRAAQVALFALVSTANRARAEDAPAPLGWLPGAARAVPRSSSASRDTPVFEYAYGPRAQGSLGGEIGLFGTRGRSVSFRLGGYAMIALENVNETQPFPREYWRGLVGLSASLSLDALARATLGRRSAAELTLVLGHESSHRTDQPSPFDTLTFAARGQLNFASLDAAARFPIGGWGEAEIRLTERLFVGSIFTHAPSFDLDLRWRALTWLQPTAALFGEHFFAGEAVADDCYFARARLGAALPGRLGELMPFVSGDTGCGKGLLVTRRESHVGFGFRYTPP